MINCNICVYHNQQRLRHSCAKCENKIVIGELQAPFIEYCEYFTKNKKTVQRESLLREYNQTLKKLNETKNLKKRIELEDKVYEIETKLKN